MHPQEKDLPEGRFADPPSLAGGIKPPPKRRRRWPWVLGASVLILGVWLAWPRQRAGSASTGPRAGRSASARAVPVTGAVARTEDLPVLLSGLGTVTPIRTVTVRTRVDGELVRVAYKEGQFVREGDLLAEIDPRPFEVQLHEAEGQLAKDQAALANAMVDLKRYEALIKDNSIPRQQLDTQAALVDQYKAALKSDEAQVDSARLNLIYCRITAPISGVVGLRLVDNGNMVHAGDPNGLVVITQEQPITVIFTVAAPLMPEVLQQVRAGTKLAVEAWDQNLTRQLAEGSVLAVDNQVDPDTNTVRIKALFANEDYALYPSQLVSAKLVVDTLRGAVVVPTEALQLSPTSTYVFVIKPDQTVEIRDVDVRLTQGDDTVIRKGLSPGELVVIDGVDKLQAGTRVFMPQPPPGPGSGKTSS
jgi:multidrug efflux system membrane fusion protein